MFVPDFFLAGAPKSGTTSLSEYLRLHPQIFMSDPKEPHFFNTDYAGSPVRTWAQYEKCFEGYHEGYETVGEASAGYLISEVAIHQIMAHRPDAKIIVLLRNPVDLVYSLHGERLYQGIEDLHDFKKAWRAQNARIQGRMLPSTCRDPKRLIYSHYGLLGKQVQRLLNNVPSEQVLLLRFEYLANQPQRFFENVQMFLNVPIIQLKGSKIYNPHKSVRGKNLNRFLRRLGHAKTKLGFQKKWGIGAQIRDRFLLSQSKRTPLDPETRAELERFFAKDVALLARLTGWNLDNWLKTTSLHPDT